MDMTTSALAVGAWTTADDLPAPERTWNGQHDGAVLLDDGTVLVAGGADANSAPLARAALFDPTSGQWDATTTGALHTPRRLHSLTVLDDGKVLAAGGTSAPEHTTGHRCALAFDPLTDVWTIGGGLVHGRAGHAAIELPDDRVLVAAGVAATGTAAGQLDADDPAAISEVLIP